MRRPTADELRVILAATATQIDPDLGNLEEVLGQSLDPGAFAMGLQVAAMALNQVDAITVVRENRDVFDEFIEKCRTRLPIDLGPYRRGRLVAAYDRPQYDQHYPVGTTLDYRDVNDDYREVRLPDGTTRWLPSEMVAPLT